MVLPPNIISAIRLTILFDKDLESLNCVVAKQFLQVLSYPTFGATRCVSKSLGPRKVVYRERIWVPGTPRSTLKKCRLLVYSFLSCVFSVSVGINRTWSPLCAVKTRER